METQGTQGVVYFEEHTLCLTGKQNFIFVPSF